MTIATTRSRVVFLKKEANQGVAVEPSSGSDAIAILADGFDFNGEKELVERNVLTSSIAQNLPRTGIKTATGSIGVEWKAGDSEGEKPEYHLLLESLLGSAKTAESSTTKAGNSTSVLQLEDSDVVKYKVGDIILIKEAGSYHISPISEIDATEGSANITILTAAENAFSDNVVISKCSTFKGANAGHPYLTVTSYLDNVVKYQSGGCLAESLSLDNFSVGQIPSLSFGMQGITYTEEIDKTAGVSISGASPATDISAGTDDSFKVSLDGQDAVDVTLSSLATLETAELIAAEIESAINNTVVEGSVKCVFEDGLYKITSDKKGVGSSVVITDADTDNVADDLNLGVENGGTETAGFNGTSLTPSFDSTNPPIALGACVFIDGVAVDVTEVSLSVDNTIGTVTSTCNINGIQSTRVTQRAVSGSFTAYQSTNDVDMYTKFNENSEFSLYLFAGIPAANGAIENVVAIHVPSAIVTGKPVADDEGIATLNVDFQAGFDANTQTDVIFASF